MGQTSGGSKRYVSQRHSFITLLKEKNLGGIRQRSRPSHNRDKLKLCMFRSLPKEGLTVTWLRMPLWVFRRVFISSINKSTQVTRSHAEATKINSFKWNITRSALRKYTKAVGTIVWEAYSPWSEMQTAPSTHSVGRQRLLSHRGILHC